MKKLLFSLVVVALGLCSCSKEVPERFNMVGNGNLSDFDGSIAEDFAMISDRGSGYSIYFYDQNYNNRNALIIRYSGKVDMSDGKLDFKTKYLPSCKVEVPIYNGGSTAYHVGQLWIEGDAMTLDSDGNWVGEITFLYECTGWSESKRISDPEYAHCSKKWSEKDKFKLTVNKIEKFVD